MFQKILIANRGEIALRILRACKEMDIQTVAVHSTADSQAMHVRLADESVCIGPPLSRYSYLNMTAILSAAEITGADAIHPGVGFLSENEAFAHMVTDHGMSFIGPLPEHISVMGDKIQAKKIAGQLGLPVVPGSDGELLSLDEARTVAQKIGFPVIIKSANGGGGRGMRIAQSIEDLSDAFTLTQAESLAQFGSASIYLEKYLVRPRHIEVQVIGDAYGNIIHLGERDCSVQRRHQKIWEEAPSPGLSLNLRNYLGKLSCEAMKKLHYQSIGTLEFLVEEEQIYFLEMNTRLQVEHPITEMITGIDLVQEQIKIAAGLKLPWSQDQITWRGHAIECRINAENAQTFSPSPGKISSYLAPGGGHVRVDSALYAGYTVPPYYDSLVSKLVVWGEDRIQCLRRLRRALNEYVITGIETLQPLHNRLTHNEDIMSGQYHVHWLEDFLQKS